MNKLVFLILTAIFSLAFISAAQAQQATATLTGVATDPNGAVIPGASYYGEQSDQPFAHGYDERRRRLCNFEFASW